jgi:hypothetical protein
MTNQGHTCDWGYLTIHVFCPLPLIHCLFKVKAHTYTLKMAEDRLIASFASSYLMACPVNVIKLLCPSPCLIIWSIG